MMSDGNFKLTQSVPASVACATLVANIFLDHENVPFGIPSYVLPHNGTQFVSKLFAVTCGYVGVRQLTTTAYHSQSMGQVKRYNKTIVT